MAECAAVLRFVFVVAVATWLGSVVSFSFVFLPGLHAVAPRDSTRLLQHLFPRYYGIGIVCGFTALAVVSLARSAGSVPLPEALRLALPVAGSLSCSLGALFVVLPRLQAARGDDARYARLHRIAAALNSTVVALLLLAIAGAVTR